MYFKQFITNSWVYYHVSYWCLWWKAWKLNSWIEFHIQPRKRTSDVLAYWFKVSFRIIAFLLTFLSVCNYCITTRIVRVLFKPLSLPRYTVHSDSVCFICKARITSEAQFLSQMSDSVTFKKRSGFHKPLEREVLWSSRGDSREVLRWEWCLLRERGALEDITLSVLSPSFPPLNN